MNNVDINYELYKVFYHVAKTLSFSEASKELFISQSAVSQSIKVLEKRLGEKLFKRSTKKVSLTKEGDILFSHIEPAVNLISLGEEQIMESQSLNGGQLRIASSDTICRYILKPYLREFHRKYPNVHIKVINGTSLACVDYLKENKVDLIVVNTPNSALASVNHIEDLFDFRDVFIAGRESFPELMQDKISLSRIIKYPVMMLDKESATTEFMHQFFLNNQLELVPEIELASNDLLIDLAKIGLGVACVPDYCISEDDPELFVIHSDRTFPMRGIAAAYDDMKPLSPAAENFLHLLSEDYKR